MKNPYIAVIERRLASIVWLTNPIEFDILSELLVDFKKIDKKFSVPFVSKLRKIADSCEAGGHKSRARMFRAVAKEFETKEEVKDES